MPEHPKVPSVPRIAALPFQLSAEHQVISGGSVTTTEERRNGVLRLEGDTVIVQWRVEREIQRIGPEIRTDTELAGIREVTIPIHALGDARIQNRGRLWWRKWEIVLTARDLQAYDALAREDGFVFAHPSELILPLRKDAVDAARDFASEVELAIAEHALSLAQGQPEVRLARPDVAPPGAAATGHQDRGVVDS
ncbi:MAG: hypothetical protein IBJ19_03635 [Gemmatimonadaceae bacterium]|nr:hypothetical protein [Gemmatimonadaceae bacterium]